jgi:hypothetical protein
MVFAPHRREQPSLSPGRVLLFAIFFGWFDSFNQIQLRMRNLALFKRKEPILGIDISPSAVKLIELSRSGQRFRVEAFAVEPLGEGMMEDRNLADPDAMWGGDQAGVPQIGYPLAPRRRRRAYLQRNHAHHTDAGGIQGKRCRS